MEIIIITCGKTVIYNYYNFNYSKHKKKKIRNHSNKYLLAFPQLLIHLKDFKIKVRFTLV